MTHPTSRRDGQGRGRIARAALCIVAAAAAPLAGQDTTTSGPAAAAIRHEVTTARIPAGGGQIAVDRATLRRLYERAGYEPLWLTAGRPTTQAVRVVDVLRTVNARGLDPADYDAEALCAAEGALGNGDGTAADGARFDVALSLSVMRLLAHLHAGRVNPRTVRFNLPDVHGGIDVADLAAAVSRSPHPEAAIDAAEPQYAGFVALQRALARYRALAEDPAIRPPAAVKKAVRPGGTYADAPALRRFLAAVGDLPPGENAARDATVDTLYDGALAAGVAAFQRRHGLEPDGLLGPATAAQLRIPLARRVRQIELALERWRWLPDQPPERFVVVNVPAFRLAMFEPAASADRPLVRMSVIVGQAHGRRHTPVFVATMREVVFRPYWDVPPSIARNELIPAIRRDRGYFDRERLEIVRGGDEGATSYPLTAENLDLVAAGTLRLRQRPGPDNALGLIKLVFPNAYNVYLHGTPAQELFARARRDFSHGCIRVEDPPALAELVLRGQAGWDRAAIEAAMAGAGTRRVRLDRPVEVYVLYATAGVDAGGTVRFYPDLYGHDAALARALESTGQGMGR